MMILQLAIAAILAPLSSAAPSTADDYATDSSSSFVGQRSRFHYRGSRKQHRRQKEAFDLSMSLKNTAAEDAPFDFLGDVSVSMSMMAAPAAMEEGPGVSSKSNKIGKSNKVPSSKSGKGSKSCPNPGVEDGPYNVGFVDAETAGTFVPVTYERKQPAIEGAGVGLPVDVLPFEVYYPTDATSGDPASFGGFSFTYQIGGGALQGPPISTSKSCYPLLVYSHGLGGFSVDNNELTRTLASYGFLVAAPTHLGSSLFDEIPGVEDFQFFVDVTYDRPRDLKAVLDTVLTNPLSNPFLATLPVCQDDDGEYQVAVLGFSLGGFTALALANGHTNPVYEKFDGDDRIKAVVAMAPAIADLFMSYKDDSLPSGKRVMDLVDTDIPTIVLSAEFDSTTPIDTHTDVLWDNIKCSTDETYRVDLMGGEHNAFGSLCDFFGQFNAVFVAGVQAAGNPTFSVSDIPGFCIDIVDNPAFFASELGQQVVGQCFSFWVARPFAVGAGCLTDDPDVCASFGAIAAGIFTKLAGFGVFDPVTQCPESANPLVLYLCRVLGALQPYIDPTKCNITNKIPTLSSDDSQEIASTYVVSFLQDVLGRDECFDKYLKEKFAEKSEFAVNLEETLFLSGAVKKVCD